MVKELIKEAKERDEEKLMNAIHQNYKDTRMSRLIEKQIKETEQKDCEKTQKKMMRAILLTAVCSLVIEIIVLVLEAK